MQRPLGDLLHFLWRQFRNPITFVSVSAKTEQCFLKKKLNSAGSWAKTSRSSQRPCRGAESPPHSRRGRTHGVAFRPCHGRRLSSSSINNGAPPLAVGTPMSERSLSQAPRSSSRLWLWEWPRCSVVVFYSSFSSLLRLPTPTAMAPASRRSAGEASLWGSSSGRPQQPTRWQFNSFFCPGFSLSPKLSHAVRGRCNGRGQRAEHLGHLYSSAPRHASYTHLCHASL